jgi:prepilin-type N-terminal cleavage/methylation domain-containing protein
MTNTSNKNKKGSPEKRSPLQKGFTLIELLVAALMIAIIVGFAGWALVAILERNSRENIKTVNRLNLDRALDFIAREVESAQIINDPTINVDVDVPDAAFAAATIKSGTEQNVLILNVPGLSEPIIYRIAEPHSNTPWVGPRAIYRWGPDLGADGEYSNPEAPGGWHNNVLIDEITDQDPTEDDPSKDPCVGPGWIYQPPDTELKGFFSCVKDNSIAHIVLERKVEKKTLFLGAKPIVLTSTTEVFSRL